MSVEMKLRLAAQRGRLLLDLILLIVLLWLPASIWGTPTERGFFCDDESLMYPYKENTVSSSMLHMISFYLPIVGLFSLELYRCWQRFDGNMTSWLQLFPVYNTLRWFLFGHAAEQLIKDMGKRLIGRLRPHFFELCQPQLADGGYCTDDLHRQGGVYHTAYTCQSTTATPELLRDVHVSFPSGHSSMAFYGLVFVALHLGGIRTTATSSLLRPLGQLLCVALAAFVGLSRVMDYKHHWSDVVAGSLLGTSIAIAVIRGAAREHRLQLQATLKELPASCSNEKAAEAATAPVEQDLREVTCPSSN